MSSRTKISKSLLRISFLVVLTFLFINTDAQTKKNVDDIPVLTTADATRLCNSVYQKKEGKRFIYQWMDDLWDMAEIPPGATEEEGFEKIRKMWLLNREQMRCYGYTSVVVPDATLFRFAIDKRNNAAVGIAVKKMKLDLNFIDPADGKSLLDFLNDQIADYSKTNDLTTELKNLYNYLRKLGLKHASEL